MLRGVIYPASGDSATGSGSNPVFGIGPKGYDHVELSYDTLGEIIQKKDQNGTVHAYDFDGLGRPLDDSITSFASGSSVETAPAPNDILQDFQNWANANAVIDPTKLINGDYL